MKLVTFGCSWTAGVGLPYEKGMSREEYRAVRFSREDLMDKHSFRGILSERLDMENVNHAEGGSSNQKQERLATEYFNQNSTEDTVVLWGITAITRNELPIDGKRTNFLLEDTRKLDPVRYYYEHFHDEKYELERLSNHMIHWNHYFEGHNIPNLWFQTFNSYQFPQKIDRLLPRDLLTNLTHPAIRDHHSSEVDGNNKTHKGTDSQRIKEAARKGFVNPYSLHPTKETHLKIADMLETPLREIL